MLGYPEKEVPIPASPENLRYHAAGHIAAALILVEASQAAAAAPILTVVEAFANDPRVNAPPALIEALARCRSAPTPAELKLLEAWFCDPFNTVIEMSAR